MPGTRKGAQRSVEGGKGRPEIGIREVTLVTAGFANFVLIDLFVMYPAFRFRLLRGEDFSVLGQSIALAILAFGLGGFLASRFPGAPRLYGLGLMVGWMFMTLFSLGFCTGVNPTL